MSTYPHEMLHNWWGNGVFVDFSGGNWCEGLTAYLADHLLAEQRGQGSEHRRDILQRVTDYVTPQTDFPVSQFRSRTDAVTEAIGYGKTAMMWNMLRERIGDASFLESLRRFYADQRFRSAGFDDLRRSFEAVTGLDLQPFFRQWLTQTGVPNLRLEDARRTGNRVTVTLTQVGQPLFSMDVPVALYTAHDVTLRTITLTADEPRVSVSFDLPAPATRVAIDPQFQVYRRLSALETPPSLSKAFGAQNVLIVAPAGAAGARYAGLVKAWSRAGVEIVDDDKLIALPHDRPVWILDRSNRFIDAAGAALQAYDAVLDSSGLRVGQSSYAAETKSLVAIARDPENPSTVLVFVSAPTAAAADGLARKLPHYGKYSWLIFNGDAPDNEAKGQWATSQSPLAHDFEPQTRVSQLPVRRALADLPPPFDAARLQADVDWLAAPARQGRGIGTQGLVDAAAYIAAAFQRAGLKPWGGDGAYVEKFSVTGENGKPIATANVLGVLPGSNPAYAHQSVVLSAHYDHLGFGWPDAHMGDRGKLHPGADDNASGVAALLERARILADSRPERTLIFAAFSGEEAGLLGSREFLRQAQQPGTSWPLTGMLADLNLDMVGRLDTGPITLLGADSASEWPFIFSGASASTGIATTVITKAVDASDDTAGFGSRVLFSPDGTHLIGNAKREGDTSYHVYTLKIDGTEIRRQGAELYTSDLQGQHVKRLTNNSVYDAEVSVSPNGNWILFSSQRSGKMELWKAGTDGSHPTQLTHLDGWEPGGGFIFRDGTTIMFRAWRTEDAASHGQSLPMTLFRINADGTGLQALTHDAGTNWSPYPAPDGHHYVFVKVLRPHVYQIFLGDLDSTEQIRLTFSDVFDGYPSISPDGHWLAFTSTRGSPPGSHATGIYLQDISSLHLGP